MKIRYARQGDLLIIEHKELPIRVQNRLMSQPRLEIEGENGHVHALVAEEIKIYENVPNQSWFAVIGEKPAFLKHPEHPSLKIKPNTIVEIRRPRVFPLDAKERTKIHND